MYGCHLVHDFGVLIGFCQSPTILGNVTVPLFKAHVRVRHGSSQHYPYPTRSLQIKIGLPGRRRIYLFLASYLAAEQADDGRS
jgi:hypothetical protein